MGTCLLGWTSSSNLQISGLRRQWQRQEDCKFEANLGYIVKPCSNQSIGGFGAIYIPIGLGFFKYLCNYYDKDPENVVLFISRIPYISLRQDSFATKSRYALLKGRSTYDCIYRGGFISGSALPKEYPCDACCGHRLRRNKQTSKSPTLPFKLIWPLLS